MKQKKSNALNLNVNQDVYNNNFAYCWDIFNDRPNVFKLHDIYTYKHFTENIERYSFEIINLDIEHTTLNENIVDLVVMNKIDDDTFITYKVNDEESEYAYVSDIVFYYRNTNCDVIKSIYDDLSLETHINITRNSGSVNLLNTIYLTQNGVDYEPISPIEPDKNIELYYNKKSFKSIKNVCKEIKSSNKGLSIIYGERGTGKTNLIPYIAKKIKREIYFIPNNLIESTLNNSEFRNFLTMIDNPVIVLDDCEMIFNDMYSKSNIYVNNLLQLIDGFLSDTVNLNVIMLFNVESEDEIDNTLLECNNLFDIIHIDNLVPSESKTLCEHLDIKRKDKNNCRLIDIIKNNNAKSYIKTGF